MKRLKSLLCLAMVFLLAATSLAAEGVVTTSIAGGNAAVVSMAGRTGQIALANNSIVEDAPAGNLVSGAVAAVNGGFFNSYYNKSAAPAFPDNCPLIHGVIVKDGAVVNSGGKNNAVGITYDGKVLIDRIEVVITAVVTGRGNATVWGVNRVFGDDTGIMLMTPELTLPFTTAPGATVFTVQNDKITAVAGEGTYTVAPGTKLLIYNRKAASDGALYHSLPQLGDEVKFAYNYIPTRTADTEAWKNVKAMLTGGRMLVQDGKNVTADTSYNAQYDEIEDQTNTSSSERSYVGVTADGKLVMGGATGTFPAIADALAAAGVTNAVSMDGGASSFLWADGNTLSAAERELAAVLQVVPQSGAAPKPEQVQIQVLLDPNTPSPWAEEPLAEARSLGLIPSWMEDNYRNPITRKEFCDTLIQLMPAASGKTVDQLRAEQGVMANQLSQFSFSDVGDSIKYSIQGCAALGIVNGTGGGKFEPNKAITRQEAAKMLAATARLLGAEKTGASRSFADQTAIAAWAAEPVDFVSACGIMNGSNGKFNPGDPYTREQTFITMLNTYKAVKG